MYRCGRVACTVGLRIKYSLEVFAHIEAAGVRGAPALLKDALRNLVENAVRHTSDSTEIIVRVGECNIQVEDRQDANPAVSSIKPGMRKASG